jgi:hypothetical protein
MGDSWRDFTSNQQAKIQPVWQYGEPLGGHVSEYE